MISISFAEMIIPKSLKQKCDSKNFKTKMRENLEN